MGTPSGRGEVAVGAAAGAPSCRSMPDLGAPRSRASSNSFTTPALRSIGGRSKPPVTCKPRALQVRLSAPASPRSISSGVGRVVRRARRRGAWPRPRTTLARVPPWTTPTLTEMPRSRSWSASIGQDLARQLANGADAPCPDRRRRAPTRRARRARTAPRPCGWSSARRRAATARAPAPPRSRRASASISARDVVAADLFVGRPQHDDAGVGRRAPCQQRPRREHGEADAGLHVEDAGAVQPAAVTLERHAFELPDRPHRVEVAEDQDLARRRCRSWRAGDRRRGRRRGARERARRAPRARRQLGAAAIDRLQIVGGRFDRHERFDEVEQPVLCAGNSSGSRVIGSRLPVMP